jgi:polyisoprenoid-binding protein YceI
LFYLIGQWFAGIVFLRYHLKQLKNNIMATKWKIDPTHSDIQFKVKHLMISTVTGHFESFDLDVETPGEDFSKADKIIFTADINSISTKNEDRDAHLKSADFFSESEHPQLRFEGTSYEADGDEATLNGNLTIRGITKPIKLKVELGGIVQDPYGQTKAGFTVEGKISRKEFGLTWNAVTEAGGVVVSDDVKIHAEVQLVKEALVTA